MIKKEVKEYKQRDKTIQRINILKSDNISGTVYIFEEKEYNILMKEIATLKELIVNQDNDNKIMGELKETHQETIKELTQKQDETIEKLDKKYHETIKKLNQDKDQTIKELNKESMVQLKSSYDQFNAELKKYITVNQLQNTALKQILELGFLDLIRNKHKRIAKDQIKELNKDNKVYELTEKKE
jgi:hypothetical protein